MTSIAKLKDRARKHEQKEDWKAAIEAYQQVLEAEQGQDELELELGLFNRIGDLYLRLGQTDDAIAYYEQAADKYAEAGFFNNAIALCNKALRHRPDRPQIYLKLSRLCAEQGFITDARRWILDFAERQVKAGRIDAALDGLRDFVESSGDPDIREFLAHQLATHGRPEEAAQHYARAYTTRMERGETQAAERAAEQARAIDPAIELVAGAPSSAAGEDEPGMTIAEPPETDAGANGGLAGLETRPDEPPEVPSVGGLGGLEGLESALGAGAGLEEEAEEEVEKSELPGLEVSYTERGPEVAPEEVAGAGSLGGLETFDPLDLGQADEDAGVGPGSEDEEGEPLPLMEEEAEPLPMLDMDTPDGEEEEAEPLPMLDLGSEPEEPEAPGLAVEETGEPLDIGGFELGPADEIAPEPEPEPKAQPKAQPKPEPEPELAPFDEPDAAAVLERARELVGRGLTAEALTELSLFSGATMAPEEFRQALKVVAEIIRHDRDDIAALQRRVEFSARTGDEELLVDAYIELAGALVRLGAETKAQAMYQRVLDLDPANPAALEGLGGKTQAQDEETVDLDAILREMEPEEVAPAPLAGADEGADPEFAAMLSQFKARVTEQVNPEDAGDHYDLGLAFKEMGLIEEAIAEFQTALTAGEERLKVYEELGQCFILKGQYNVALKVFQRAIQVPTEDGTELLGVYYHLGQCHEELGQRDRAREAYERVLAIDAAFQDVPDRLARL